MKHISFVIPTYNFARFIPETLESILREDSRYYEIIVYDGFSDDNTPEIMRKYTDKFDCIKYIRSMERKNIDVDLNAAVAFASGKYVWTLSSDDVLIAGWLDEILNYFVEFESDIFLLPAVHCTLNMEPQRNYPILRNNVFRPFNKNLESFSDLPSYLAQVRTSEGLFSFCSSCIIRRDKIAKTEKLEAANGTCWRYASRMIQSLLTFPSSITILDRYILHKRGENDSFGTSGRVKRMEIAILKWTHAISILNLPTDISNILIKTVHSDIGFLSLLYTGQFIRSQNERMIYKECVEQKFSAGSFIHKVSRFILLAVPTQKWIKKILTTSKTLVFRLRSLRFDYNRKRE